MKVTILDLRQAARQAIDVRKEFVLDCAADISQQVDNVAQTKQFENEVMLYMTDNFDKYSDLREAILESVKTPKLFALKTSGPR